MTVVTLTRYRAEKSIVPAVVVERLLDHSKWQAKPGEKCMVSRHGFRCHHTAQFIVYALGTSSAWLVCDGWACLTEKCKSMLERPKEEADKLEREQIERAESQRRRSLARKEHKEQGLCTQSSQMTEFGLCPRAPAYTSSNNELVCARHAVYFRKRKWTLIPIDQAELSV